MIKKCIKCGEEKDLDKFEKRSKGKFGNKCKVCVNLSRRKTPIPKIPKEGFKFCSHCDKEKMINEFPLRWNNYHNEKRHTSTCKECERKRDNEKYSNKCSLCGIEYKSGRKNTKNCVNCHRELMRQDKIFYQNKKRDFAGEKNSMYGVRRFGKDNPNYKHDKTDEERILQRGIEGYSEWRRNVYERDNYTCQCCGDATGGNLNAHHLNGYSYYDNYRTRVENGITLCEICHKSFHKEYGIKNNNIIQFIRFCKKYKFEIYKELQTRSNIILVYYLKKSCI